MRGITRFRARSAYPRHVVGESVGGLLATSHSSRNSRIV